MSEIVLSPVKVSDAEALAALRVEAMRESLTRVGRFDPERARQRFLDGFRVGHTREILWNGERVGFVVVERREDQLMLDHFYVLPAAQGQGLGSTILFRIIEEAEKLQLPIRLGALRESASNRFYERHGFVLTEKAEFDNYYVREPRPTSG